VSADPNYRVADAIRKVALRLDEAFQTGKVDSIDANRLSEILLLIAEELDPPLPTQHESPARG
jgi:hypothetical protein